MKKKMMSIAICCLMVVTMVAVGCKKNNVVAISEQGSPIYSVDDTQPVIIEDPSETPSEEPSEVVIEDPPEEEDPLEMLLTEEANAEEIGGLFLGRNEKLYTLAGAFRKTPDIEYPLGAECDNPIYHEKWQMFCISCGSGKYITVGGVPAVDLQPEDSIRAYSKDFVPVLEYEKIERLTYSLPIDDSYGTWNIRKYDTGEVITIREDAISDFKIVDVAGNEYPDMHDLEKDVKYTVSWFEGTTYYEEELVANCRYAVVEKKRHYDTIEGSLNKDGYAEFNLSALEKGFYIVHVMNDEKTIILPSGSIIEIK